MRFLLLIMLACGLVPVQAQSRVKFRATDMQVVYNDKYGDYATTTEWEDSSMSIVVDISKKILTTYSKSERIYDLLGEPEIYDSDVKDMKWFRWKSCLDPKGIRCVIRILKYTGTDEDTKNRGLFYIGYLDVVYVFRIKNA